MRSESSGGSRRRRPRPMPLFDGLASTGREESPPAPAGSRHPSPPTGGEEPSPLFVQAQGARVGSTGERLRVEHAGESIGVPAKDLCHLVLCGGVSVTSGAISLMARRGIPIVHATSQARPRAITMPLEVGRGRLRRLQCLATTDRARRLEFSRRVVAAKIGMQRTLLRRNAVPRPGRTLRRLKESIAAALSAPDLEVLRGVEGRAARWYFRRFDRMLRGDEPLLCTMQGRNRRPPRDPINAMLSFGYALLLGDALIAVHAAGLEPSWGLLHDDRPGRPALALDLMEEFRALVVDSAVVSAVNRGMIEAGGFERQGDACMLNAAGRIALIRAYEQRMSQQIVAPGAARRRSIRAVMHRQAHGIAKWIGGDPDGHHPMATR
jgi:CRISPR-associated protein Cas1